MPQRHPVGAAQPTPLPTARRRPQPRNHGGLAPVVDLTAHREREGMSREEVAGHDAALAAARHWRDTLAKAGLDFDTPQPPATVMKIVASELERIVGGLLYIRQGGGPQRLPANPDAGVDLTSALEYVGVLRELGMAPDVDRAHGGSETP